MLNAQDRKKSAALNNEAETSGRRQAGPLAETGYLLAAVTLGLLALLAWIKMVF